MQLYALIALAAIIIGSIGTGVVMHGSAVEELKVSEFQRGQNECRAAVEAATQAAKDAAVVEMLDREREFNARLLEAQRVAQEAQEKVRGIKDVAKSQHLELNAQASGLQCVVPDATIDTLNRPIKIGAQGATPPPAVPKKETVAPVAPAASPAAPPASPQPPAPASGGGLPAFLKPGAFKQ